MPTVLLLSYTVYSEVTVPNDVAEKLKVSGKWADKWGNLLYEDENGKTHIIKGVQEVDFKRSREFEWMDPTPESLKDLPNVTFTKVEVTKPKTPSKIPCRCGGCLLWVDEDDSPASPAAEVAGIP